MAEDGGSDDEFETRGPQTTTSAEALYGSYTWTVEEVSKITEEYIYSDIFSIGGYNWRLLMYPRGNNNKGKALSVYLCVPDFQNLDPGWSRLAHFTLAVKNQKDSAKSHSCDGSNKFRKREHDWGFQSLMELTKLHDPGNGFVVGDRLVLQAKVQVVSHVFMPMSSEYRRELSQRHYKCALRFYFDEFLEEKMEEFDEFWDDNSGTFCAFWAELSGEQRLALLQVRKDTLLRKIRERLFTEKHVDCNLALDVLYLALASAPPAPSDSGEQLMRLDFAASAEAPRVLIEICLKPATVHVTNHLEFPNLLQVARRETLKLVKDAWSTKNKGAEVPETEEAKVAKLEDVGPRVLAIFAMELILQDNVLTAYRDKVARVRQENLIREEEDAKLRSEEKKRRQKEKKKKKKQLKNGKAEEAEAGGVEEPNSEAEEAEETGPDGSKGAERIESVEEAASNPKPVEAKGEKGAKGAKGGKVAKGGAGAEETGAAKVPNSSAPSAPPALETDPDTSASEASTAAGTEEPGKEAATLTPLAPQTHQPKATKPASETPSKKKEKGAQGAGGQGAQQTTNTPGTPNPPGTPPQPKGGKGAEQQPQSSKGVKKGVISSEDYGEEPVEWTVVSREKKAKPPLKPSPNKSVEQGTKGSQSPEPQPYGPGSVSQFGPPKGQGGQATQVTPGAQVAQGGPVGLGGPAALGAQHRRSNSGSDFLGVWGAEEPKHPAPAPVQNRRLDDFLPSALQGLGGGNSQEGVGLAAGLVLQPEELRQRRAWTQPESDTVKTSAPEPEPVAKPVAQGAGGQVTGTQAPAEHGNSYRERFEGVGGAGDSSSFSFGSFPSFGAGPTNPTEANSGAVGSGQSGMGGSQVQLQSDAFGEQVPGVRPVFTASNVKPDFDPGLTIFGAEDAPLPSVNSDEQDVINRMFSDNFGPTEAFKGPVHAQDSFFGSVGNGGFPAQPSVSQQQAGFSTPSQISSFGNLSIQDLSQTSQMQGADSLQEPKWRDSWQIGSQASNSTWGSSSSFANSAFSSGGGLWGQPKMDVSNSGLSTSGTELNWQSGNQRYDMDGMGSQNWQFNGGMSQFGDAGTGFGGSALAGGWYGSGSGQDQRSGGSAPYGVVDGTNQSWSMQPQAGFGAGANGSMGLSTALPMPQHSVFAQPF